MFPPANRNQSYDAQVLYDARAPSYDQSWHPRFARHMVELAAISPGAHVLDLACGTGLATFAAARAAGSTGLVVGVDISAGMLAEAKQKLGADDQGAPVELYQHSIAELRTLDALKGRKGRFDVITCCSALVLLEFPEEVVRGWMEFLKPGGRVVVDVTHPMSLPSGVTMERVGRELGRPVMFYRLNFQAPGDLVRVLEGAGLGDVEIKFVSQMENRGSGGVGEYLCELDEPVVCAEYSVEDADEIFERSIEAPAFAGLNESPEVRQRAKEVFKQQWARIADFQGKVESVDMVFVGIGTKV